jgi:hypothetical protein
VQDCWKGGPDSRPEFKEIVDRMLKSDDYVANGTNMDEYRAYRRRIVEETKKACEHKFMTMTDHLEGGCVSIEDIANDNDHVREYMDASIVKMISADPDDQAYRPYDFLKEPE